MRTTWVIQEEIRRRVMALQRFEKRRGKVSPAQYVHAQTPAFWNPDELAKVLARVMS